MSTLQITVNISASINNCVSLRDEGKLMGSQKGKTEEMYDVCSHEGEEHVCRIAAFVSVH